MTTGVKSVILYTEVNEMKLQKTIWGWHGLLEVSIPEERDAMVVLGTKRIPLPFTNKASEQKVREYYNSNPDLHQVT